MTARLANLISQPREDDNATAAQQKRIVTYSAPIIVNSPYGEEVRQIFIAEAQNILASSGVTGLRTWEAALHLGHYLCDDTTEDLTTNQSILELGAGTGFISLLCTKVLGAMSVLATDGSLEVVDAISTNKEINHLKDQSKLRTAQLLWGADSVTQLDTIIPKDEAVDLILGADITYDRDIITALVTTLKLLLSKYPLALAVIATTVRNEQTLQFFVDSVGQQNACDCLLC